MGSQFVDLNADGRIDYVTATFDGSPHVAYGAEGGGFEEPVHLFDVNGKRVMLEQYWDFDKKQWVGLNGDGGHCISAVAFDWDDDGDFDLLLGDKSDGDLYLQRNDGKAGAPAFTGQNTPVLAGGKRFGLSKGMTAPRLVDWDGDGLTDIVAGSFGGSFDAKPPGGVYLYRNVGKVGAPEFAAAQTLIAPSTIEGSEPDRPNVGLYADPVDYDGDGDLDLVVGGYSIWSPPAPELSDAEQTRLAELKKELALVSGDLQSIARGAREASESLPEDERAAHVRAVYKSEKYTSLASKRSKLQGEHDALEPGRQRTAAVWVYLRESE